ncbi:MAG: endo-1,3-alpha-glucanase family glycosylhydrolase [Chloroflexota bacterium]
MTRKLSVVIAFLVMMGAFAVAPTETQAQSEKQVWAYYMGFWFGPGSWDPVGGLLDDRPARGSYDVRDGGTMGAQIDEAKGAGIDAFIFNWRAFPEEDQALSNALDRANERGFKIGISIDAFGGGDLGTITGAIGGAQGRLGHPAYLRYQGKPVLFFAFQGNAGLTAAQWVELRNQFDPNRDQIWMAEGLSGCCIYSGAMDGMWAFNLAWSNGSAGRMASERSAVTSRGGTLYVPTIHPGWDETKIAAEQGRTNPTSPRARNNGAFLRTSFQNATNIGSDVILIVSWNEFLENSHIEPSTTYGTQSLDTLRPLIATWKGTGSAEETTAEADGESSAAPAAAEAAVPTGITFTLGFNGNVRQGPSSNAAVLGQAAFGSVLEATGRSADNAWVRVNFNGQSGWVSLTIGTLSQNIAGLPVAG